MHFLTTIRRALALFAILSCVSGFDINLLLNVFDEVPPVIQAAFGLRSKRQTTSQIITASTLPVQQTPTVIVVTPSTPPPAVVTTTPTIASSGPIVLTSVSSIIVVTPSPSPSPSPQCGSGSVSFSGGCCPSASLLNCNDATFCTSKCPQGSTTTPTRTTSVSSSSLKPISTSVLTSSSAIGSPTISPGQSPVNSSPPPNNSPNNPVQTVTANPPNPTGVITVTQGSGSNPTYPPVNGGGGGGGGSYVPPVTSYQAYTVTVSGTPIVTSTPLPVQTAFSNSTEPHSSGGLSTGAKAGIGAGIGLTFCLLLALLLWLIFSRRGKQIREPDEVAVDIAAAVAAAEAKDPVPDNRNRDSRPPAYTPGRNMTEELDGVGVMGGGMMESGDMMGGAAVTGGGRVIPRRPVPRRGESAEMDGRGMMGRRGEYAEAEGNWEIRYELSPTMENYSEMPAMEPFRGHEMDAKGPSWPAGDMRR